MTWKHSIADLTGKEIEAVEELKRRTINDATPGMLKDEYVFYRFCKAREFNVKLAEEMIRKHIQWRKEFQIDTIMEDYKPLEVMKKFYPVSIIGFDKEGCPIRYIDLGNSDMKGILDSVKKIDFIKYNFILSEIDWELCRKQTEKLGRPITKVVYILNAENMTLAKATHKRSIDMFLYGINCYQDNFPERLKLGITINASIYFSTFFNVLKTIIVASIMKKLRVYGSDGWKEVLLEVIDADVLPAFLGGTKTDPDGDPTCSSFLKHGQKVPPEYRLQKSERRMSLKPDVQKLNVTRFSKSGIEFYVNEPNSYLEWQFETKNKDIAFGVYFKPKSCNDDDKPLEMVPKQRIDTNYGPEVGMYKCDKVGTYILMFDNSYSWIFSKEIYYRTRLVSEEEFGKDTFDIST